MPQNIAIRVHATVTCALSDLVTFSFGGDAENVVYFKNNGPGVVWLSFDPANAASVAGVNCFGIKTGETFTRSHVLRNTTFTAMADTASTILCVSVSAYPS